MHEKGVLHLNLKPENILIKNGEPVLADFGFEMLSLQKRSNNSSPSALELYVKTTSFPLTMSPEILKHNNFSKSVRNILDRLTIGH